MAEIGHYSMYHRWFESRAIWDQQPLFRAKATFTGEWVKGYFTLIKGTTLHSKLAMITPHDNLSGQTWVEAETLTRYIGCVDKNGQLIFEGDIVECWDGSRCLVEIDALGGAFLRAGLFGYRFPYYAAGETAECTIVGNIFDNPDMIGEIQAKSDDETNMRHKEWRKEICRIDRVKEEEE